VSGPLFKRRGSKEVSFLLTALYADRAGAFAIHGIIALLNDRSPDAWFNRLDAHDGRTHAEAARHFVLNRRYEEAVTLYRKALGSTGCGRRTPPGRSACGRLDEEARQHPRQPITPATTVPPRSTRLLADGYTISISAPAAVAEAAQEESAAGLRRSRTAAPSRPTSASTVQAHVRCG
jgi:hypothetical protein